MWTFDAAEFDIPINRRDSNSYKWDDNERLFGRADLLPFWVADMDFATPTPILEAIRERSRHPVIGYDVRRDDYVNAVRSWLEQRHGWSVPEDWLMFCPPSSIVGIQGLLQALTMPGDSVLVPTPNYGPLLKLVSGNQRRLVCSPLSEQAGVYRLDAESIAEHLEDDSRMLILSNPHNPTGRVFSRAELEAVAVLAEERDLLVISDEVHADLVMPGHRHIPYGSIGGDRSVTVLSPNKAFNTAGLPQASLVIPDPKIRQAFQTFLDTSQLNHDSTFGAVAMIAAYQHCAPWLDALLPYLADNHRLVSSYLGEQVEGVRSVLAEGTYLAWLDCRKLGLSDAELMRRLVEDGGVGLYAGSEFGPGNEGFLRMNVACPRDVLRTGLAGIQRALGSGGR